MGVRSKRLEFRREAHKGAEIVLKKPISFVG